MAGVIEWWSWLPRFRWRIVAHVEAGDFIPEKIPRNGVVVVSRLGLPTWVAFDCPCRTGHRIMVNLDGARRPHWRITSLKPLSISPSFDDVTPERRCHFFLRRGKIQWVAEDGADL